jgi:hypothetical protein
MVKLQTVDWRTGADLGENELAMAASAVPAGINMIAFAPGEKMALSTKRGVKSSI